MRRNIKNDKVLRAITIGLATMIAATSAPVNVWADDDTDGQEVSHEEHDHDESTVEEPDEAKSCDTAAEATEDAVGIVGDAAKAIATEEAPVVALEDIPELQQQVVEAQAQALARDPNAGPVKMADFTVQQELAAGIGFLNDAQENLEDASCGMWDAAESEAGATEAAQTAVNIYVPNANEQLAAYNTADTNTTNDADSAITNANTANTSESRDVAVAARDAAVSELSEAEKGLVEATNAYNDADKAVKNIQSEYNTAVDEHEKAVEQAEAAAKELSSAKTNAQAASERLKAARSKAEYYENRANQFKKTMEELKAIQEQSYAMMVIYSRMSVDEKDADGNKIKNWNNKPYSVFNEGEGGNGTLDIAATVKKLNDEAGQDQIDFMAEHTNGQMKNVGRYLTRLLVKYMIENDEGIDLDDDQYEFKFGVDGKGNPGNETVQAGTVYKNKWGNDEVYVGDNPDKNGKVVTDGDGNVIEAGDKVTGIKWNTKSGKAGRDNYVVVKYKDANGNPQTRKYNYVYKNSKYGDKTDIENGLFYLAEIDDEGNATRVASENNFDNYGDLLKAIDFAGNAEALESAKQEVADAAEEVETLRGLIAELESFSLDEEAWNNLKNDLTNRLEEAQSNLDAATEKKAALEEKVEEARRAVAGIDLSRFDDDDDDDDDDADAADDGVAAPAGFTFTGTPSYVTGTPAMTTLPGFGFTGDADGTGATGVLGVRTGGGTEADEGSVADSRTNVAPRADFSTVNKVLGSRQNKDNSQIVKKIKDNEIPLAEIPNMDDEVTMNWMWLLIIFLLGATGKKMYDEYKKKKEAEEAAKINK